MFSLNPTAGAYPSAETRVRIGKYLAEAAQDCPHLQGTSFNLETFAEQVRVPRVVVTSRSLPAPQAPFGEQEGPDVAFIFLWVLSNFFDHER
jgi:hypothetical protein